MLDPEDELSTRALWKKQFHVAAAVKQLFFKCYKIGLIIFTDKLSQHKPMLIVVEAAILDLR